MNDTTTLTGLITALRSETQSSSISPENVGMILQNITDIIADAATDVQIANVNKVIEKVSSALTRDYQDVIDKLGDHEELINELQDTIAGIQIESAGQVPIYAEVYDGTVYIHGHEALLEQGYKPFLFRFAKKSNRNRKIKNGKVIGHSPHRKGWLLVGRENVVNVSKKGAVSFAHVPHEDFHIIDTTTGRIGYISDASSLMDPHTAVHGDVVSWGRSTVKRKGQDDYFRMLRFPFAIGFAKPSGLNMFTLRPSDLASTLATFSVIQDNLGIWCFSR